MKKNWNFPLPLATRITKERKEVYDFERNTKKEVYDFERKTTAALKSGQEKIR